MYDPNYRSTPVIATNEIGMEFFNSRKEASEIIAKRTGCSPHTTDKEIKLSIRHGEPRYGYQWKYAQ